MEHAELLEPASNEREAELAKVAQRCIMAVLDHSRAPKIALINDGDSADATPTLELPPQALRFFADMLGMMAQQLPIVLMPQNHEMTTQDVANFLNVSRPFIVKQIEAGNIKCRKVGRHRRVEFSEVLRFKNEMTGATQAALQELADMSQELDLGY